MGHSDGRKDVLQIERAREVRAHSNFAFRGCHGSGDTAGRECDVSRVDVTSKSCRTSLRQALYLAQQASAKRVIQLITATGAFFDDSGSSLLNSCALRGSSPQYCRDNPDDLA